MCRKREWQHRPSLWNLSTAFTAAGAAEGYSCFGRNRVFTPSPVGGSYSLREGSSVAQERNRFTDTSRTIPPGGLDTGFDLTQGSDSRDRQ